MADRLQREIEQILRAERGLPRRRRGAPDRQGPWKGRHGRRFTLGPAAGLLGTAVLLLVALPLWAAVPELGMALIVGAAVLLLVSLSLTFGGRPGVRLEKRWRGQIVPRQPGPLAQLLRAWWRRLRR